MKKNIITAIIWVLVLSIAYCGYKMFLLYNYKTDVNTKLKTQLQDVDVITINSNPNVDPTKRVKFKKLLYQRIGTSFEFDEETFANNGKENYYTYIYNDEVLNTYAAIFKIGLTYSLHDILDTNSNEKYDFNFKNINRNKLLSKYNLNNDYELLKYIVHNYGKEMNVLNSGDRIKFNYAMTTFANVMIPAYKISLIEGDYQGYIYTVPDESLYEVHIINGDQNYVMSFTNGPHSSYFTLDNIKQFISNISFSNY